MILYLGGNPLLSSQNFAVEVLYSVNTEYVQQQAVGGH